VQNRDKVNAKARRYRANHPEKIAAYNQTYYSENAESMRARATAYRQDNPEMVKEQFSSWYAKNGDALKPKKAIYRAENRGKIEAYRSKWELENPHKRNAINARRRATKLQATPAWADQARIAELYAEAVRLTKETGIEHHVDHIVPLVSKLVCGLHCEFNLRVTLGAENLTKGNRHWPDMP
jgi:hypothetical protein